MQRFALAVLLAVTLATINTPAVRAGIADSPLPTLVMGQTTLHLYSVLGVHGDAGVATVFECTSTDTAAQTVGVELFDFGGGGALNDATMTASSVPPGGTIAFQTSATANFSAISLGSSVTRGSARILSTSKKLACTAIVADRSSAPPTVTWPLTIIAKVKQKAAN